MNLVARFRQWDHRVTLRARAQALRSLKADYTPLDTLLQSDDCAILHTVVLQMATRRLPNTPLEERHWFEEAYRVAQHRGCTLSGWKLRFVLYYHYGQARGDW
jgi:hypothetical protein